MAGHEPDRGRRSSNHGDGSPPSSWLPTVATHTGFMMTGNGGQKVVGFPSLGIAVAVTTADYGKAEAHQRTDDVLGILLTVLNSQR